ncbi:MAG: hypothetical protein GVY19_05145 [Bacteroidetes bacterium]|nr:hypothetical protein [Bacteroidota bacterium]
MEIIINQPIWDDLLDFDELVNDFEFRQRITEKKNIEKYQLENEDLTICW